LEVYRETSAAGKEPLVIGGIVLVLLLAWLGWVGWNYARGTEGLGSLIYVLCFFGLFLWRYAFRYTCILTDREFVVLSAGLGSPALPRTPKSEIRETKEIRIPEPEWPARRGPPRSTFPNSRPKPFSVFGFGPLSGFGDSDFGIQVQVIW